MVSGVLSTSVLIQLAAVYIIDCLKEDPIATAAVHTMNYFVSSA